MLIYGRNAVQEALRGRRRVRQVWASGRATQEPWLPEGSMEVEASAIDALVVADGHQGVCAQVSAFPYSDAATLLAPEDALVMVLDEVTDPQNLGAICRSAECAGATGVVIPERRAAEVTPAVCKASAGAVEHLPIARVRNLADFLTQASEAGAWAYGAAAGGERRYDQPDYSGRVVLVMGAEGKGLRPRVAEGCDELVSLPLNGRIESLNVSVTAAVLLYEVVRQRASR